MFLKGNLNRSSMSTSSLVECSHNVPRVYEGDDTILILMILRLVDAFWGDVSENNDPLADEIK